jgi:hypothetical protein
MTGWWQRLLDLLSNHKEDAMPTYNTAQYVWYNDGTEPNVHALVCQENENGTLNLELHPDSGQPWHENGVPRREPSDYDEAGGGRTWHLDKMTNGN